MSHSDKKSALLFLSPSIFLFLVFVFYPLIKTAITSLFLTDSYGHLTKFTQLGNYQRLISSALFQTGFIATLIFVVLVVVSTLVISLLLAVLTINHFTGVKIFRLIFSSSLGVSVAAGATFWLFIFNPKGYLNQLLSIFHLQNVEWLTSPSVALISVAITTIWMNIGFSYLLLLGGLQNIDPTFYEAGQIAGISKWSEFRQVTLPLASPTIYFVATVSMINAFQTFGQIDLLTQGGPNKSTSLLVYQIYQDAFLNYNQGQASAGGIILFILIALVTFLQTKISNRSVHYQ